jgi:molybdenum cofactor biosynthesis enzyme MoaA
MACPAARNWGAKMPNGKTLSLIAGTTVCNARCDFCISKTTPFQGMGPKLDQINRERLEHACGLAKKLGIQTVLITSKGEPTIYPEHISTYLLHVQKHKFSSVELQTNAILFGTKAEQYDKLLAQWHADGLGLIAISIVHYEGEKNRSIYTKINPYMDLPAIIAKLHGFGYKVRLSCTLVRGYVDSIDEARRMIQFAIQNKVEQLTLRRMEAVDVSENEDVSSWTRSHMLAPETLAALRSHLDENGKLVGEFFYGARLYEYGESSQNVCLTTGLTDKILTDDVRQLIFFPSGRIITDWRYDSGKEGELVQISGIKTEG